MAEQRTTPEMRAALRERAQRRDEKGWEYSTVGVGVLLGLLADADALAGALAEVGRLRKAIDDALYFHSRGRPFGLIGVLRRAALAPQSGAPTKLPPGASESALEGGEAPKSTNDPPAPATGEKRRQSEGNGQ